MAPFSPRGLCYQTGRCAKKIAGVNPSIAGKTPVCAGLEKVGKNPFSTIRRKAHTMITAIVLIKAEPKSITGAATKIAGIDGVSQVYSVSGEWDLVAILEVTDYEAVATIVTEKMAPVPGLLHTQTLTAFRAYSKKDLEQAWDIGLE